MPAKKPGKRPGKGSRAAKEAKRKVVAAGVVAGKSARAIARAAGCDVRHVQRLAQEPETRFLVTELMRPHRAALQKLAGNVIKAVADGLKANLTDKADHPVRLRAVQRFRDLANLAADKEEQDKAEEAKQFTWEEFVVMYHGRKETLSE